MPVLEFKAKRPYDFLESQSFPETKLFNAIFKEEIAEAKKRVKIVNGNYRYYPSQEYSKHYCRMKLNLKK